MSPSQLDNSNGLPSLGFRLPNSGPFATPAALFDAAVLAERLGYHTAWVHDHISWPLHELTHFSMGSIEACQGQDSNFFESVATLAAVGGRVGRIRLGVAGLVLPLRDPRVLAKQLATLDLLTGGRVTIAVGVGAKQHDFDVMQVRWDRRGRIMDEYLPALRALLDSPQPVSFHSEHLAIDDATLLPRPSGIRIWVAGKRPSLPRVVQHADGWLVGLITPERYGEYWSELVDISVKAGRDPATIDTAAELFTCVGRTHEEAVALSATSLNFRKWSEEDATTVNLVGTIDEVCDRLRQYRQAGAQHVEMRMICQSMQHAAEMAEEIAVAAGLTESSAALAPSAT